DTIEYAPFDADSLPGRIGPDKHVGEVLVEYVEASLMRDQADMNVRTSRLGWRLGQIFERLHHVLIPMQLVLEQRRAPSAEHDVELISEGVERARGVEVDRRHEPAGGITIRDHLKHYVLSEKRIAFEVHLRDEPLHEAGAKHREMDVRRPPRIDVVTKR